MSHEVTQQPDKGSQQRPAPNVPRQSTPRQSTDPGNTSDVENREDECDSWVLGLFILLVAFLGGFVSGRASVSKCDIKLQGTATQSGGTTTAKVPESPRYDFWAHERNKVELAHEAETRRVELEHDRSMKQLDLEMRRLDVQIKQFDHQAQASCTAALSTSTSTSTSTPSASPTEEPEEIDPLEMQFYVDEFITKFQMALEPDFLSYWFNDIPPGREQWAGGNISVVDRR